MTEIEQYHSCEYPLDWKGCYDKDSKYSKYITDESFAHPAKMSWGLLEQIFKHLQEMSLIEPGTTIVDFMAGTFRTGIMAELFGYKSIGIELEPHFIKMIEGNRAQIEKMTGRKAKMEFIQGDARQLSGMLKKKGYVGISSPPYSNIEIGKGLNTKPSREGKNDQSGRSPKSPSQIATRYCGVVSPPYSNAACHPSLGHAKEGWGESGVNVLKTQGKEGMGIYSHNPENIGNLKDSPLIGITSPPYQDTTMPMGCPSHTRQLAREGKWDEAIELEKQAEAVQVGKGNKYSVSSDGAIIRKIEQALEREKGNYSDDGANIGNLPDRQLIGITSPPYESADKIRPRPSNPDVISQVENNIERDRGESYLQAMKLVYSEAYRSGISPLVLVTKNPTRQGALRRLDLDTCEILIQSGYEIFDYHHAILFTEHTQGTLDGDTFKKPKGRLSFFKRLSYAKGNAVAQWEDVIFARIPNRQGSMTGITSPPYSEAQTGGGIAVEGYRGKHINEMGKNQPDKVGDRCGYMKKQHGKNPANIGNLPDKVKP